ncbi:hypothetical protein GRF29_106g1086277 [Pseudopithomyces chartarum]|uniref:Uncharacterized protein n=1 Tax=Pseudopithomyces chartarum TaxID=1892770 RepID=A0AAN6REB6_9PLEO|nr:hypothetical protein GRF29_106g1086277 [Pseudopithomyces chartarum]
MESANTFKRSDAWTRSINFHATEIVILQYQCIDKKVDPVSAERLKMARELRRSQAIGNDPNLFAKVLYAKSCEWTRHHDAWGPRGFLHNCEADPPDKLSSLERFAAEIIVLEFQCVNLELAPHVFKSIVRQIDKLLARAMAFDETFETSKLVAMRRDWTAHWLSCSSIDYQGRLEYGMLNGVLMVGTTVMTRRSSDGQNEVIKDVEEVAENVKQTFEKAKEAHIPVIARQDV